MLFVRTVLRLRSLNVATGTLLMLLQRTPLLRDSSAVDVRLVNPAIQLLRAVFTSAVALGAVHSLAGASTQLVSSVALPAKAAAGQPFSMTVVITGLGVSFAQSWDITNTLPPGVTPQGATLSGGQWVINTSSGALTLAGTPTATGTYSFTARGYQFTNRTGPVTPGSTSIVVAAAPNAAPAITRQPAAQTVTAGSPLALAVTYTGSPAPTFQWLKDGVAILGATSSSLAIASAAANDAGNYTVTITNSLGTVTSLAAAVTVNAAPSAPLFTASPQAQTATAGGAVIFSVGVSAVPAPALQWMKDGVAVTGATSATLIVNNVSPADAGLYSVSASNASGTTVSRAALLTVSAGSAAPAFSAQPGGLTAALGSTVALNAAVSGAPAPALQWQRNGADIPGATLATLVLNRTTRADAATYALVATNASGVATSTEAVLTLVAPTEPGRITNLSILTPLSAGETMMMGTVLGGADTSGSKPVLVRAAGPSLVPLGVTGVLPDPKLSLVAGNGATVAVNNDWSGDPTLANAFTQVGAFAYTAPTSKDAAIFTPALAAGSYTVQVSDATAGAGQVIAEIYDSTPASAFSFSTPRLVNVSVMKQIATGGSLTAGFVIGGGTATTVLVRAIGPGLAAFGVGGTMADPRLALFAGSAKIAENDNWGGDAQLTAVGNSVGAFALAASDSKDAMIVVTLPPGQYSAQVSGAGAGGTALVEVYEVP